MPAAPEGALAPVREEVSPDGSDEARPLSKEGRRRFRRAVRGLGRLGVRLDRLYHSPLLRAVETADLLVDLVGGERAATPLLAQPPDEALLALLEGPGEGERVGLVGHEPWLSQLCAWLAVGNRKRASGFVLKKGGVAWLEGEARPGKMRLRALLPPRVLRAL
ncbi:SixA phosphatase family protein [Thermus sp. FJN-A]